MSKPREVLRCQAPPGFSDSVFPRYLPVLQKRCRMSEQNCTTHLSVQNCTDQVAPEKVILFEDSCSLRGGCMDTNTRQIALSVLENLREDLAYARLNNGRRILDVADLRQYIYEQIGRIRTTNLALEGLYSDNGHRQGIGRSNGHDGKATPDQNWQERGQH